MSIEGATASQIRQSLQMAKALADMRVRFVPMPCTTEAEFAQTLRQMNARLDKLAEAAE